MEVINSSYNILAVVMAIIVSLIMTIYFYSRYKLNYWKRRGVDQAPNSHWLFGNFKDAILFKSAPGLHLGKMYRSAKPGVPFIGFYIFHKPCLLVCNTDLIKQILIRNFQNFSNRNFAGSMQKDSFGMRNLFGLRNEAWKYLRTKITPTLSIGKIKDMLPFMLETCEPMMEYINVQKLNNNGTKEIDVQMINYRYSSDLIANIALGTKMNSFFNPNTEFNRSVMNFFHGFKRMVALIVVFFVPELVNILGSPIFFNVNFVKKVIWKAIKSREKSGIKRGDYIDSILELKNGKQNPLYKFEGDNLLYQAGTFFSGFESNSTMTAFTLMEIARNKDIQDRVRDDIENAIKAHDWTYAAFNNMKYLAQCMSESLRLHPPVPILDRTTKTDYTIPGTDITIEKGTAIYISLYGLHRDEKYFHDPEVFNPERFSDCSFIPDAYMPFGTGPKMCVGIKLGELHAKIVIAKILMEYEIYERQANRNGLDPRATFTIAVDGINLALKKINN